MKMEKNKQTLPPKENSLFKRILRCYEQKQYKNGLKFAKLILTNFPDHGETLAMKGLTLNCLGKKEEAYNFVRLGLRNNLMSHVCWHVYGLLQRSDKKYEEAIKCYRNALKWDKDNLQILRDLSLLQIQMRDLEGYKETRYKLFDLRPSQRASWIGYAMSLHLFKEYDLALKVIEEFRKTSAVQKNCYDYEYSELVLYQNMILRESGKIEEALDHLKTFQANIFDKPTLQEIRGELLLELDRKMEASEVYRNLINRNPENKAYYLQLEKALSLSTEEEKLDLYSKLKIKYPRAHVPRKMPLNYATGQRLEDLLNPYLLNALRKGIPQLFTDVKGLYDDSQKAQLIEKIMLRYLKNLEETGHIDDNENDFKEPASILYCLIYLSQHYSYLGDASQALKLLQRALDHTPTLIELYIIKGKILKHAGDYTGASEALKEAQSLDTADRYVNSKAASYLLAAGQVLEAEEMCSKFTREGISAMENLNEMQCMWFQTECAEAYYKQNKLGLALQKCHEIDRHFTEIIEDQFDFHTYCMRKMTLRSYIELLRLEDILRNNRFYWTAAIIAIKIYLKLFDHPITESNENAVDTSTMTPSEMKKYKNKQKKGRKEQAKQEEKKKEENKKDKHRNKNAQEDCDNPVIEELIPSKLERPDEPLQKAINFLVPLQNLASNRIHTHIYAFEIYWRKKKPLLMLQSLKRALNIDSNHPDLHTCIVRFLQYFKMTKIESEVVSDVIEQELEFKLNTLDPVVLNEKFLNRFNESAPHRLQAARGMFLLDTVQRGRAFDIASCLDSHLTGVTLEHALATLEWFESNSGLSATQDEINRYKNAAHTLFPYAIAFNLPSQDDSVPQENSTNLDGELDGISENNVDHKMSNCNHTENTLQAVAVGQS